MELTMTLQFGYSPGDSVRILKDGDGAKGRVGRIGLIEIRGTIFGPDKPSVVTELYQVILKQRADVSLDRYYLPGDLELV